MDFATINDALMRVKEELDHNFLNEIKGLAVPTLENICLWVANVLKSELPELVEIEVARLSIGESCVLTVPPSQSERQFGPCEHA